MITANYLTIPTRNCIHCNLGGFVYPVWHEDYKRYVAGANIQDAFPDLSAADREQLLTGIHPRCWEILFPEEKDNEND